MWRRPVLTVVVPLAAISLLVPASAGAQSDGSVQPRIVGGHDASISQYPWQAAVVFSPSKASGTAYDRQFCGGSLLTSRIVITAAHCVFDTDPDCLVPTSVCVPSDPGGDGSTKLDADDVDVVLGRTTLSNSDEGAEVGVSGTAYRANYDGDYRGSGVPRFDVGYLILNAPSAQPQIHLAGPDERNLWEAGDAVEVSGWGSRDKAGNYYPDNLQAAMVNIVSDSDCTSDYGSDFDAATMVCAAAPGTDTCFGDSGGPLQAPLGGGVYRLVGITSWGKGCAQPHAPGVYTRVADTTLGPLIASDVANLESTFGLPAEPVFPGGDTRTATKGKTAANPFAKCKRIRDKQKRKRCVKRVKKKLRTA